MRTLLVHPPVDYAVPGGYWTEALGLGYVAATLRRDGHEVEVFDAYLERFSPREAIREIVRRDFDCLGITAANVHKKVLISTARAVRARKKDAVLVAGGYLPTLNAEQLLAACPELDFIIRGEGEAVASDVFGRMARGEDWRDAPGVAYMKEKTPVMNPLPPLIQDLDSLPFPARDALTQAAMPVPALITSSRGCYRRCSFCCSQVFYALSGGRVPRFRSPENVVNEIESVVSETGVREFRFVDDDFLGPGRKTWERAVGIAEEIRARKLDITFRIECRADEADEDTLKLLKEAGLIEVFLGIESGVQRQLDTYNKRMTVEQNRRAIETVRRLGVGISPGFIMLDPYVTAAEVYENVQFIRETGLLGEAKTVPARLMSKLALYRGVPLVEQLRADGLLREKGIDVDYVFKDRQIRVLLRIALPLVACFGFFRRLRKFLGRRRRHSIS